MYEKERRIFAILSVVCWMAYVLCLFVIKQELIADILSPTCAFFAALSVGLVSFSNQKYKLAISLIALGPIFWMLADVLYIFNDLGMIGDDQIVALSIPIYRMTSYAYVVGLLGFTIVQYKKHPCTPDGVSTYNLRLSTYAPCASTYNTLCWLR